MQCVDDEHCILEEMSSKKEAIKRSVGIDFNEFRSPSRPKDVKELLDWSPVSVIERRNDTPSCLVIPKLHETAKSSTINFNARQGTAMLIKIGTACSRRSGAAVTKARSTPPRLVSALGVIVVEASIYFVAVGSF